MDDDSTPKGEHNNLEAFMADADTPHEEDPAELEVPTAATVLESDNAIENHDPNPTGAPMTHTEGDNAKGAKSSAANDVLIDSDPAMGPDEAQQSLLLLQGLQENAIKQSLQIDPEIPESSSEPKARAWKI